MPRLFTGLELPPALKSHLSLYRGGLFGARWVEPDDYHLTLRFIGEIDERTAHLIADDLARLTAPPFRLSFSHLDVFGGHKPHTLYAAVKPDAGLLRLQAEHERLMRRHGLAAETRKFTPHVTLARLSREAGPRQVADYLSVRGGPMPAGFDVEECALFSAREGGGGPYLVEESYSLAMPALLTAGAMLA